jgi:hypothetical protein
MASYGVFTAVCGFEYHGPKGTMAFAPRLTPENFRAAFTGAEGWGTFMQIFDGSSQRAKIEVKWGQLGLKTLTLTPVKPRAKGTATAILDGKKIGLTPRLEDSRMVIDFHERLMLSPQNKLEVVIG